jgi:hypothetical protein
MMGWSIKVKTRYLHKSRFVHYSRFARFACFARFARFARRPGRETQPCVLSPLPGRPKGELDDRWARRDE